MLTSVLVCAKLHAADALPAGHESPGQLATEFRGRLLPDPKKPDGMQFRSEAGTVYPLVSNRMSSALFLDTNLLSRTLLIKGTLEPRGTNLTVTGNLHSIHDGKIYELFCYCDVCTIQGIDPGPCMCCREPVHLVEEQR